MKMIRLQTVFLLLCILLSLGCSGKKKKGPQTSFLFPYEVRQQQLFTTYTSYGYMDVDGNEMTTNKFYIAEPFTEGLGCVGEVKEGVGLRFGFIDSTGQYVIQPLYSDARPFHEGLALVSIDNKKYGFINKKGDAVTPFVFDKRTSDYHNGYCYAYEFVRMVSGSELEQIIVAIFTLGLGNTDEPMFNVYKIDRAGKQELLDSTAFGTIWADMNNWHRQNHMMVYRDHEKKWGYKKVTLQEFINGKRGGIDTMGTIAIRSNYFRADDFVYGYARVRFQDGNLGYIDTTGKVILKYEYNRKSSKKRKFPF